MDSKESQPLSGTGLGLPRRPRSHSRLIAASSWAVLGTAIGIVGSFATNVVLTRVAPPVVVGGFLLAYSIVYFVSTLGSAGLNLASLRFVSEALASRDQATARGVVERAVLLSGLASTVLVVLFVLGGKGALTELFDSPELGRFAVLIGVWSAVEALRPVVGHSLIGLGDIKWGVICNQAARPALVTLILAGVGVSGFVVGLDGSIAVGIAGSVIATVAGGAVLLLRMRRLPKARRPQSKQMLGTGFPLMVSVLAVSMVGQGDIWVVAATGTGNDVALYGSAVQSAKMLVIPLFVVNILLTPLIARLNIRGKREELEMTLRASATLTGYPALFALIVLFTTARPLFGFLYGAFYADAAPLFLVLCVGQVFTVVTGSSSAALSMTGHQRLVMGTVVSAAVLTFVMEGLVGSLAGTAAIAVVSTLGTVITNSVLLLLARRRLGIWSQAELSARGLARVASWTRSYFRLS